LRQTRLQPKIAELQKKHSANKQKLNEEMAKLYKEEGVNPASGCLWSFIQMPIMIALFYAIRQPLTLMMGVARNLVEESEHYTGAIVLKLQELGFTSTLNDFYLQVDQAEFISQPDHWPHFAQWESEGLRQIFYNFGPVNLASIPDWQVWNFPWDDMTALLPIILLFFFPIISGGAQFISASIMRKMNITTTPEGAGGAAANIIKFMPLMSVWFGFILPAALSLYWTIGTVLQIAQDIWLTKKYTKILDEEDAEKSVIRKAKEAELETKRLETERKKAEGLAEQNINTSKRKKQKGNKQGQLKKAAEWEKKNAPEPADEKYEPSRVGNRRFARGRAYDPDRYSGDADEELAEDTDRKDKEDDLNITAAVDEQVDFAEREIDDSDDLKNDYEDSEDIELDEDEDDSEGYGDDEDEDGGDYNGNDDDDDDDDVEIDNDEDDSGEEIDNSSDNPPTVRFDTKRFDSDK
jgi:YidC/Oxa1 family membrane protein insertase